MFPAWLVGLRPRLVVVFVLVAFIAGLAASLAGYDSAREGMLTVAQDERGKLFRNQVSEIARRETVTLPPTQETLDDIGLAMPGGGPSLVAYGRLVATNSDLDPASIPAELRRRVRERSTLAFQRVEVRGEPQLLIGSPLIAGNGMHSGIEIYYRSDLSEPANFIDQLTQSTARTVAVSVLVAVLLGLVAARGVLRPVRDLRKAARGLAAGQLDTRLKVRGSDELADLARTFNSTAAALEQSVGELRQMESNARRFVADVSHELRTPLAAMTAVSDTLDEEAAGLDDDGATAARLVSTETRKLTQLVENLIEISRFDAGKAALRPEEFDVAAAVRATLAARGWAGTVKADLVDGLTARLDRRRLDVSVANLVGNALRHGAEPVTVELRDDPDWVIVVVTDSGTGLPPDILPHVFERFYKADSARARSEGSGLGLAIAWENARLHGGTIEAANVPEGGARFTLILPRRVTTEPKAVG
jgi:two-component system, OmpR family, sensor histidine kinase MtrB